MEIGPKTKVTWPLFLGIIAFGVLVTIIKSYFVVQNETLWYAGVGAIAVLIVAIIKKLEK